MTEKRVVKILVIILVLVSLFASISIASASNPKARILIDDYHGADLGSTLKNELTDRGFEIEINSDKTLDSIALGEYDVLVIAIPDKEISETEINAVLNYVSDGGNLVLLGKAGGVIDSMNNLSKNFGIEFNRDTLKDPSDRGYGWKEEVIIHSFISHPVTKDIRTIAYYYPRWGDFGCTLSLSGSASALAIGDDDSYSEVYEKGSHPPVLAVSSFGDGKAVGYGCYSSWLRSEYAGGLEDRDNKQLALNIFHYLTDTTTIEIPTTHIYKEVEAGKKAEYEYTIKNLDAMKAKNAKLTVDGQAKDWISFSDNNFDIDGFSSKDITITIAPPEGTEAKTYNAEMSVSAENAALYKGEDKTSFLVNVKRFTEPLPTPTATPTPTSTPVTPTPAITALTPAPTTYIPMSAETPTETPSPTPKTGEVSVYLHGEKTKVTVGEDIILSLSAVNLITRPTMTLQLILKVPSGMSVTSTGFVESGSGQYTSTYTVEPGEERHIEVHIKTNQVGKFNVEGDICYYFGGDKSTAEYKTVKLPVKVNPVSTPTPTGTTPTPSSTETPGFEVVFAIAVLLAVAYLARRKKKTFK